MSNQLRRGRRIVRVIVAQEILGEMIREGYESRGRIRNIRGIPADASYIGARYCADRDAVALVYQHESFPLVLDGDAIPDFDVEIGEVEP